MDFTLEEPGTHDLRLFLPEAQVEAFRAWLHRRVDRETSPFRELTAEYAVLDALSTLRCHADPSLHPRSPPLHQPQRLDGRPAHSLQEIYDAAFHRHWNTLRSLTPDTGLYWVSADQIHSDHYSDTIRVQADVAPLFYLKVTFTNYRGDTIFMPIGVQFGL